MPDHLPFALLLAKRACGSNGYANGFSVRTDIFANLVIADDCEVPANNESQLFGFDLATQF